MPVDLTSSRRSQRGAGTLMITLILLVAASLAALYVNRGVLAEQRASGNQLQATLAHEVAEAGIEWATGMLNLPSRIGADCNVSAGAANSFGERYVFTQLNAATPSTNVVPATNVFPGCKIDPTNGTMTCHCPNAPGGGTNAAASLGSTVLPSFTVAFQSVAGDAEAVKVTVWACSAQAATCTHLGAQPAYESADGNARVTAILKLRGLAAVPAAPLTCGTSCDVNGSFNVINRDVATNGVLINAGTGIEIDTPPSTATTLDGQPAVNALIANDCSLARLTDPLYAAAYPTCTVPPPDPPSCDQSKMFETYFGQTIEQYRDSQLTKRLSCGSAADCKTQLDAAYNEGWRSFYFDSDLQLSGNNTYGTQAKPIVIVTPNAIKINGDNTFYGLIFSNSADWNDIGTGSATIYGAQVTCAAYNTNGNGTLEYDPEALKNVRRGTGVMVRVPGSWRDFRVNADNPLP